MHKMLLRVGMASVLLFSSVIVVGANDATSSGKREERIEAREKKIEEFKATRQAVKEDRQEKREEAKERWTAVKDEKKLKILERVELNLQHINERATNHFMDVLDRLGKILDKIEARAEKGSKPLPNLTAAQTAMDSATAAVTAQAAKTYDLTVTSESSASGQVRTSMQQLKADLSVVREKVKAAREAVHAVLKQLKGETSDES